MPVPRTPAKRRRPVLQVTLAALTVQALVQGLVAHSVVTRSWWGTEWMRLQLHLADPKAAGTHSLPQPGWEGWLPSAATAVGITFALVLLALLVVRVGRGWWLLAVAALPLVPVELEPGSWAPPLPNQVAYALVWPAHSTGPQTTWAWVSASITALLVILPAATLAALRGRRAWIASSEVIGRLFPVGLGFLLWLGWQESAGEPTNPSTAGWRGLLVVIGAMALTGVVRKWQVLVGLAVLPALAAGAVRWTTDVDGVPAVVTDQSALWMSAFAVAGGLFAAVLQPALGRAARRGWAYWRAALAEDVERHNQARQERAARRESLGAGEPVELPDTGLVPDEESELDLTEVAEPVGAAVSRRPARAASARAGGRHRA